MKIRIIQSRHQDNGAQGDYVLAAAHAEGLNLVKRRDRGHLLLLHRCDRLRGGSDVDERTAVLHLSSGRKLSSPLFRVSFHPRPLRFASPLRNDKNLVASRTGPGDPGPARHLQISQSNRPEPCLKRKPYALAVRTA